MAQATTEVRYGVFDPTGNVTALVETAVDDEAMGVVAAAVMARHPKVEQVGFCDAGGGGLPALRMAGGEFCGNATMCAALLRAMSLGWGPGEHEVSVRVSGAEGPVRVRLDLADDQDASASVLMPPAVSVSDAFLVHAGIAATLPLVRMQGIAHLVVVPESPFARLLDNAAEAERAVREWCELVGSDCLGLMFLGDKGDGLCMTPLVFVPGADTLFWEGSCASGTSAVGMVFARDARRAVELELDQPGGTLRVSSVPFGGDTWLTGQVSRVGEYALSL